MLERAASLLATFVGGFLMSAIAAGGFEPRIVEQLAARLGVPPDDLQIVKLTPRDLPAGAAEYYVEPKGGHGHDNVNAVVLGGRIYASGHDGEFARLLREQSLLARADLSAAQAMRLYSLFALPRQLKYLDANALARDPQRWRDWPQVQPPALARRPEGGLVLTFYATPVDATQPSKWTVTVSPAYEVTADSEAVGGR